MVYLTFASHASADHLGSTALDRFLDKLRKRLAALAIPRPPDPLFVDHDSIRLGGKWTRDLMDSMVEARAFVFMISPRFEESPWCGRELAVALKRYRRWEKTAYQADGRLLFPVIWEVNLKRRQATGKKFSADLPPALSEFQYTPSPAWAAYEEFGLSQMMVQKKHQAKIPEFVDLLAKAILTGLDPTGTEPISMPSHAKIADFQKVNLPAGWTNPNPGLFEAVCHVCAPGGVDWKPRPRGASLRTILETRPNVSWTGKDTPNAPAQGVADYARTAVNKGRVLLLVVDAATPPDDTVRFIHKSKKPVCLAFLLVGSDRVNASMDLDAWIAKHGFGQGHLAEAMRRGCAKLATAASLGSDIDFVVQQARGLAIKSHSGAPARDVKVALAAKLEGIYIESKPSVTGPGGRSGFAPPPP